MRQQGHGICVLSYEIGFVVEVVGPQTITEKSNCKGYIGGYNS